MKFLEDNPQYLRYLDGDLPELEQARLLAQLGQEEKQELMSIRSALSHLERLPQQEPPAGLVHGVMAAIQAEEAPRTNKEPLISRIRAWFGSHPLLGWQTAGMAVTATVTLTVSMLLLQQSPQQDPATQNFGTTVTAAGSAQGHLVKFKLYAPGASTVSVVGDFNQWGSAAQSRLIKNGNGEWTIDIPLSSGNYQYAFVVDKKVWIADPRAAQHVQDDFGRKNALLYVI